MRKFKVNRMEIARFNEIYRILDRLCDSFTEDEPGEHMHLHTCIAMMCYANNIAHNNDRKWRAALAGALSAGYFFLRKTDDRGWGLIEFKEIDPDIIIKKQRVASKIIRRKGAIYVPVISSLPDDGDIKKGELIFLDVPYYLTRKSIKENNSTYCIL